MPWDQVLVLVTGPTAIGLSQVRATERWACIVGLIGQAGWFHATWTAGQMGMFAASFVYAGMWLLGLYRHWIRAWWSRCFAPASATTPTDDPTTSSESPEDRAAASNSRHPDPMTDLS
jgi:hypothetical protein